MPVYRFTQTPDRLISYERPGLVIFEAAVYALEVEIGTAARGHFWAMRAVPIDDTWGQIVVGTKPVSHYIPGAAVILCEPSLGMFRCDFTTDMRELPPPWVGPGTGPTTLEELVKMWEKDVGKVGAARFNNEGGFSL